MQTSGWIQIMQTDTGETSEYDLHGTSQAYPYSMFPLEDGQKEVMGILNGAQAKPHIRAAHITLKDSSADVTSYEASDDGYTGGQPWAIEYSAGYAHAMVTNTESQSIRSFAVSNGQVVSEVSISKILDSSTHKVGGLAVRN